MTALATVLVMVALVTTTLATTFALGEGALLFVSVGHNERRNAEVNRGREEHKPRAE